MTLLPDNLTDDDLVLLQLAGELPDEADAAVAQRLATNPQAGSDLRGAWAMLDGHLSADGAAISRLATTSAVSSARSVVAAMKSIEAAAIPAGPAPRRLRWPPTWTLYPLGAAAAVVLAMVGWWYNVHDEFAAKSPNRPYDPNPAVLILPGTPDGDPAALSDDEIAAQFNSMIPDRVGPFGGGNGFGAGGGGGFGPGSFEREYAALEMLENPIQ